MPWYKDRDFSEVKSSNADVVAVIENPTQLQRVIDEHNALEEKLSEYHRTNRYLRSAISEAILAFADIEARTRGSAKDELADIAMVARRELADVTVYPTDKMYGAVKND